MDVMFIVILSCESVMVCHPQLEFMSIINWLGQNLYLLLCTCLDFFQIFSIEIFGSYASDFKYHLCEKNIPHQFL